MKMRSRLILGLILCAPLLSGTDSCDNPAANTVEFTILHTNDIHSHLRAERAGTEKNPFNLGGLARMKTLADRIRGTRKNVLFLDAGDWSEAAMHFAADGGSNMLRILDAMGCAAAVVGNHDFLNGPSELASTIERAHPSFPVLGVNKDLSLVADRARIEALVAPRVIYNVGGVRVGIIGLMTEDVSYYDFFKPGIITSSVDAAIAQAREMHEKNLADVIVLLSHNNWGIQTKLAQTVPWVNVVISGHEHRKTAQPVTVMNAGRPVYVAEARHWGQFLGDMTLAYDRDSGRVTLKSYELRPVTPDLPEDPGVAAIVADSEKTLAAKFGRDVTADHVGDCADEVVQDNFREVPLTNMMADAYRAATGARIGLESVQLTGQGVGAQPLSTMDVFNMAPHVYGPIPGHPFPSTGRTWTLKLLTLPGVQMRGLLNATIYAFFANIPLSWISLSGVQVDYSPSGGASPIRALRVLNPATGQYQDLDDNATYTIALHDGLLYAIELLKRELGFDVDLSNLQDSGIQPFEAILSFLAPRGTIHAPDFEPGGRYRTLEADLGFYEHSIALRSVSAARQAGGPASGASATYSVAVTVRNQGLASSAPGLALRALRSAPTDILNDFTPGNESVAIGPDAPIPPIAPDGQAVIEIPWNNLPGPGIYSLNVSLVGQDGNPSNNNVTVHRVIPAAR